MLGERAIHAISSPEHSPARAIHVYLGDIYDIDRSVFDPDTLSSATSLLLPGAPPVVIEVSEPEVREVAGVVVSRAGRALSGAALTQS